MVSTEQVIYPVIIATRRMVSRKAITNFRLNIPASMLTSGMLAPAPPINRAMTVPMPMPLSISATPIGMMVSALMYRGMPMIAATGTENGLPGLATDTMTSSGSNP